MKRPTKPTPEQQARQKLYDQIAAMRPSATQIRKIVKQVEGKPINMAVLIIRHFYQVLSVMDEKKLNKVLKATKKVCEK